MWSSSSARRGPSPRGHRATRSPAARTGKLLHPSGRATTRRARANTKPTPAARAATASCLAPKSSWRGCGSAPARRCSASRRRTARVWMIISETGESPTRALMTSKRGNGPLIRRPTVFVRRRRRARLVFLFFPRCAEAVSDSSADRAMASRSVSTRSVVAKADA